MRLKTKSVTSELLRWTDLPVGCPAVVVDGISSMEPGCLVVKAYNSVGHRICLLLGDNTVCIISDDSPMRVRPLRPGETIEYGD